MHCTRCTHHPDHQLLLSSYYCSRTTLSSCSSQSCGRDDQNQHPYHDKQQTGRRSAIPDNPRHQHHKLMDRNQKAANKTSSNKTQEINKHPTCSLPVLPCVSHNSCLSPKEILERSFQLVTRSSYPMGSSSECDRRCGARLQDFLLAELFIGLRRRCYQKAALNLLQPVFQGICKLSRPEDAVL